jgi:hypothetical protein
VTVELDAGQQTLATIAGQQMKWFGRSRRNWGLTLLGVWLVLSGLLPLIGHAFPHSQELLAILAVAAGVLLLAER